MIEKIDTTEAFVGLKTEWNELLEASAADCFFLTWEWLFTWWRYLSGGRELFILAFRSEGELIALAPLVAKPARFGGTGLSTLEFLGSGAVGSDYLDLIIRAGREDEAIRCLAEYLGERKLMLELGQLGEAAAAFRLAAALGARSGYRAFALTTDVCPYVDLSGHTWASYLAGLGSSHRANFSRRLKQLDKNFKLRFAPAATEDERREALAALIELHRKRWRDKGSSEAFSTPDLAAFHGEISRLAFERGWLRLFVLWLNDAPAAALYGFRRDRRFYFFQSGLDPEYSRHSVGLVAMGLAIKSAVEEGAVEYDLLHGGEAYKFLWARAARDLGRLELYPPGAAGLLCGRIAQAGRIVRKLGWTILPKPVADKIATARRLAMLRGYYAAQSR